MKPKSPRPQRGPKLHGGPKHRRGGGRQNGEEDDRGWARASGVSGVRGLGGSNRPSFSSSGETDVNSDTAEQTTLRTAL